MKKSILISLLLLFVVKSFGQGNEKLPEIPWKTIAETYNQKNNMVWSGDVTVKLFGNITKEDSLLFAKAVKKLNSLTETINIKMSSYDRGTIEFYLLDSLNVDKYSNIVWFPKKETSSGSINYIGTRAKQYINTININKLKNKNRENYYLNILTFSLYPAYWIDHNYFSKNREEQNKLPKSIYRSIDMYERDKLFYEELHDFDIKLLTAVYSSDFDEKIKLAKKQYGPLIPWWLRVKPFQVFIIPFVIIFTLLLWLLIKAWDKMSVVIKNKFARFNLFGVIGLLLSGIIFSLYYFLAEMAKHNNGIFGAYFWHNLFAGVVLTLIIGIPTINLLRFIEIIILSNTHKRFLRVVLIFLSTALIPSSAVFAFVYFLSHRKIDSGSIGIMAYIFLALFIIAAFRAIISYFFYKEKDLILENERKLSSLRELKAKAELNVLHSRINPHFLYNSLNSIAGLAHSDADKTEHMALSLSKLFRYSINKEKSDWTTLKEELEMVKIYLDVEKVRFDDRLVFSVVIPVDLEKHKIPRFIIQPLVENAVKHGISKSVEGGEIKITITKNDNSITISVADSGHPFPDDLTPGFGIQSIYDKLEILYKERFEMKFINSPQKQVTLIIR